MLKTIATCIGALVLSTHAFSQESAGTMELNPQETPRMKWNTFEIKPGELLAAAVPGIAAAGATFETKVTPNWAALASASYLDVKISGGNMDKAQDATDEPLVKSGYGYATGLGLRYYEDPIGDSTYGGGQIDYSEMKAKWEYDGKNYQSATYGVTPSLVAGYRWIWQNGLAVRLGAGAGMARLDSMKVNELAQANTGVEKIEDLLDRGVVPKIDIGIGYQF